MLDLLRLLCAENAAGRPAALATIVFQAGSAPRGAGSRLVANEKGLLAGTTGGGLAEANAIKACGEACRTGQASVLDINMDGTLAAQSEMICGGRVRLLIEPFLPNDAQRPLLEQALEAAERQGCRIVRPFPPQGTGLRWSLVMPDGGCLGTPLPPAALTALQAQQDIADGAAVLELAGAEYFVECCEAPERMIIVGGGHVSRPTAYIAAMTHFAVHVLDDREEFANALRFPDATVHVTPEYTDCLTPLRVTPRDYIVIVTRGHLYDAEAAAQALRTPAGYIGMIGSSRKRQQIYEKLGTQGFTQADIDRIHSPIGLNIGAQTPEEIAVSILAECIAHRRLGPAKQR